MKRIDVFRYSNREGVGELPPESAAGFQSWINRTLDSIPREFFDSAAVEISSEDYYESHCFVIEIYYFRPETAEEIAEKEAEKQARIDREQRDKLNLFLRLKAEFGDK
jgi:hypothetical protein